MIINFYSNENNRNNIYGEQFQDDFQNDLIMDESQYDNDNLSDEKSQNNNSSDGESQSNNSSDEESQHNNSSDEELRNEDELQDYYMQEIQEYSNYDTQETSFLDDLYGSSASLFLNGGKF